MAHAKEGAGTSPPPPPPSIGKIGPYTVFMTPPATPTPSSTAVSHKPSPSPSGTVAIPIPDTPRKVVQPPPIQYPTSPVDRFAFLRRTLSKLHQVHSSVDECMANWLGLDQSKYQWALNDYYQAQPHPQPLPMEKGDVLTKEVSSKSQTV